MKFFSYSQNNSGGKFIINDKRGIGPEVWVEAENADDANQRAEDIGIYFNGCDDDRDCPCCGDRWSACWGDDDGEASPKINKESDFDWHNTVYVHAADGLISRITNPGATP